MVVDREKVIKELELIRDYDPMFRVSHDDVFKGYAEDALALLKAQELPNTASISSAIECLLHPQDADDSDMAKAIDTAVRAMRLLKAQEPVDAIVIPNGIDRSGGWWFQCPSCKMEIEPRDRYCKSCGQAVKWE